MKSIRKVLAALREGDLLFNLLEEGDKVGVGLSGGKDSFALLKALTLYRHYAHKNFQIVPIHLNLGFSKVQIEPLESFCESLNLKLVINDATFTKDVLIAHQKEGKHLPCSICSRMKKAAMVSEVKRLKLNKIAFAHHLDDAFETFFLNLFHGGRFSTFEPKMELKRGGVTFIRPFYLVKEEDITRLAEEENFPKIPKICPADGKTERQRMKDLIKSFRNDFPSFYGNLTKAFLDYEHFSLPFLCYEISGEKTYTYTLKPLLSAFEARTYLREEVKKDEKSFLVLKKEKVVASFSYQMKGYHRILLYRLRGEKEALEEGITILSEKLSKTLVPLYLELKGPLSIKKALGFTLTTGRNGQKIYAKTINH